MSNLRLRRGGLLLALVLLALSATRAQTAPETAPAPPPTARIEWREVEGARAYELEINDAAGIRVFQGRSDKPFIDLALPPGDYSMRIVALNVFQKPASESPWMDLSIVQAVLPRVESVEPRALPLGRVEALLVVKGEGVFRGTRLRLERGGLALRGEPASPIAPAPATPAPAAPVLSEGGSASLAFRFELKKAVLGDYDLILENPGGMKTVLPSAFGLRSPAEYWLALSLPPLPAAGLAAALPEPEPPLALGWGPVERERWGGRPSAKARGGKGGASLEPGPEGRPKISLGWSQGLLLDPEFSYLYGPSYLGGLLGFELPFASLFAPPAFLRGAAFEARLGFQLHPALLSSGAEGKILFGNLGGGLSYGTDFASTLNIALRAGADLVLTSFDSEIPGFAGRSFSLDPALYAGVALRFEQGRQVWELGLEWSGTFYLDFFMNRLRAGISWGFDL